MKAAGLLLLCLLAACAAGPAPAPEATLPNTLSPTNETPTQTASEPGAGPQPAAPAPAMRTQYWLQATLDYAAHYLHVRQEIEYSNNNTEALGEILLVVEAQRQGASFQLLRLETVAGPAATLNEPTDGLVRLTLAAPLAPGEALHLAMEYELYLPRGPALLGWTERQTNLVDWYPYAPPYRAGQGWLAHSPAAVGEHGVYESADFEVHIRVRNAPAGLSVAAPAPAEGTDGGWLYRLENARRFVWSASGHYRRLDARQGDIPISVYFFEEQRDAAEAALRVAREAIEVYSGLFGPYPYEHAAIVMALFPDGMESDGLFFLDQHYFITYTYDRRNYLTALTAHEIAHNWWFGQVGSDQALEPWLDESLAIYCELLYYQAVQPDLENWWWDFRIQRFAPGGWVGSRIYDHNGFAPYVHAVYMRGALFLHELRGMTGDEAFFAFLRDYAEQGRGRIMGRADFFALLAQHSDADISGLLAEYFED
ncbi:MAG: M1 family metallopeptidase [Anaerolineales bacterium]|nr:M1 family metallopeptidase [Anaerolineales bacterium]